MPHVAAAPGHALSNIVLDECQYLPDSSDALIYDVFNQLEPWMNADEYEFQFGHSDLRYEAQG